MKGEEKVDDWENSGGNIYIYRERREIDAKKINGKRGQRFGFVSCYSPFVETPRQATRGKLRNLFNRD